MSACHERGEVRPPRWGQRADGLEESIQFTPGYNCPVPGGSGHGVHGMEIHWFLRGPDGAVSLAIATNWIPGELRPGHGMSPDGTHSTRDLYPMGFGIEYHARAPRYEGDTPEDGCGLLGGAPCYWDRWYGGADEPVRQFIVKGEQAIWDALETAYADLRRTDGAS